MSSGGLRRRESELATFPTYELAYLVDDPVAPTTVTIYDPESPDLTTRWITVEAEAAIPIETIS